MGRSVLDPTSLQAEIVHVDAKLPGESAGVALAGLRLPGFPAGDGPRTDAEASREGFLTEGGGSQLRLLQSQRLDAVHTPRVDERPDITRSGCHVWRKMS